MSAVLPMEAVNSYVSAVSLVCTISAATLQILSLFYIFWTCDEEDISSDPFSR